MSEYAYKRINHVKEILDNYQYHQRINMIPDEILTKLEYHFDDKSRVTYLDVKNYLKSNQYFKYYDDVSTISCHLKGYHIPSISEKKRGLLTKDFEKVANGYNKVIENTNRKGFMSYNYLLYKLCQLNKIGSDEWLREQYWMDRHTVKEKYLDNLWERIAEECNFKQMKCPISGRDEYMRYMTECQLCLCYVIKKCVVDEGYCYGCYFKTKRIQRHIKEYLYEPNSNYVKNRLQKDFAMRMNDL